MVVLRYLEECSFRDIARFPGTSYQSRERMRELAAERGYPFPFLIDVDGIYEKYRPRGNTLFLIDRSVIGPRGVPISP